MVKERKSVKAIEIKCCNISKTFYYLIYCIDIVHTYKCGRWNWVIANYSNFHLHIFDSMQLSGKHIRKWNANGWLYSVYKEQFQGIHARTCTYIHTNFHWCLSTKHLCSCTWFEISCKLKLCLNTIEITFVAFAGTYKKLLLLLHLSLILCKY